MVAKNNQKVNMKRRNQNQKFPYNSFFDGGGWGGPAKNGKENFWFWIRERSERARRALA